MSPSECWVVWGIAGGLGWCRRVWFRDAEGVAGWCLGVWSGWPSGSGVLWGFVWWTEAPGGGRRYLGAPLVITVTVVVVG